MFDWRVVIRVKHGMSDHTPADIKSPIYETRLFPENRVYISAARSPLLDPHEKPALAPDAHVGPPCAQDHLPAHPRRTDDGNRHGAQLHGERDGSSCVSRLGERVAACGRRGTSPAHDDGMTLSLIAATCSDSIQIGS
jgi:hypothetical protein